MLLPNEWIENSIETYIYQHTTKSQIIYWGVLAAVAAAIIALPRAGKWGSEAGD